MTPRQCDFVFERLTRCQDRRGHPHHHNGLLFGIWIRWCGIPGCKESDCETGNKHRRYEEAKAAFHKHYATYEEEA